MASRIEEARGEARHHRERAATLRTQIERLTGEVADCEAIAHDFERFADFLETNGWTEEPDQ